MSGRKRSAKARARSRAATAARATGNGGRSTAPRKATGGPVSTTASSGPASTTSSSSPAAATSSGGTAASPPPRALVPARTRARVFHPVAALLTVPPPPFADPAAAFDALYSHGAGQLVRQVELLTGSPELARRAVRRAYDVAWQRWPEVARDSDPVGWVRAQAHSYALAPWQRWVPGGRRGPGTVAEKEEPGADLRRALLRLGPERRRAVLLYDGLGLDLSATATEVEASTIATAARVIAARQILAEDVPGACEDGGLPARLAALLTADPEPAPGPTGDAGSGSDAGSDAGSEASTGPTPATGSAPDRGSAPATDRASDAASAPPVSGGAAARAASERGARHRTAASLGLAALVTLAIAVGVVVTPDHGAPHHPHDPAPVPPPHSQPR